MSPARARAGRGTWRAVATLALAFTVPIPSGAIQTTAQWRRETGEPRPAARARQEPEPHRRQQSKTQRGKATVEDLIRREFGKRADEALRVARCESRFDPHARSGAGATGVFQIMPVHRWRVRKVGGKDLTDADTNVKVARSLFKDEGWRPWTCARRLGLVA